MCDIFDVRVSCNGHLEEKSPRDYREEVIEHWTQLHLLARD